MPNSFIESPNGLLYVTSGMDPVLRWDGATAEMERSGITAPTSTEKTVVGSSSNGAIVGAYTAYVRYVDAFGNYSNLSPVSDEHDTEGRTGAITDVTPTNPIEVRSNGHGLSTNDIVQIEGVGGINKANGTFNIRVTTSNKFELRTNNAAKNPVSGSGTYNGGGTWTRGVGQIDYTDVPISTEQKVVRRQILRNTDGQALVFYVDIDTEDLTSTTFSSTREDSELSTQEAVALASASGKDLAVSLHAPPPDDRPVSAHLLGRMFFAGVVPYRQGSIAVTFGSKTVTGVGTEWTEVLPGRLLDIDGARKSYEIAEVDTTNQTLTLVDEYVSGTDPFASYAIWPPRARRYGVDFSEAGLVESVAAVNSFTLEKDEGDGDVTALLVINSRLYIVQEKRSRVLSFLVDPAPNDAGGDGSVFPRNYRGVVNFRCPVIIEDAAYLIDEAGIHIFTGNQDEHVSTPVQEFFGRGEGTELSIDWTHKSFFHAVQDEANEVMRWFVSMSSAQRYPRHCICYAYRHGTWWIEEFSVPICCSAQGKIDGQPKVFLGSTAGRIFEFGGSELDGPEDGSGDTRGTATSSTLMTLVDSAASFPTAGVVGAPVFIVDGTGKGQRRMITAVAGTTLTVDQPWTTALDTTSVYQIGGIDWTWKSSAFRYAKLEKQSVRRVEILAKPTPTAQFLDARLYQNRSDTPVNMGYNANADDVKTTTADPVIRLDMTRADGYWNWRFDGVRQEYQDGARFLELELRSVKGQDPQQIYSVTIDGVTH